LDYELWLTEKQDLACHTAEEVFNPNLPTLFKKQLGCLAQLISVGAYFALMIYFMLNYPEKAEWVIFGGIILFILIIAFLDRLDRILFPKKMI
jgi:hypothetical protein